MIEPWQAIASSADGVRLVAAAFQGSVYISTNGGNTCARLDFRGLLG